MLLVDTERCPQQPLDKAASCVLTDRSLSYERASWQQCADCEEWSQETNIEYIFQCALGLTPGGSPAIDFELKTRYPAYTCSCCRETPATPQTASASGHHEADDEEIVQLCPLHVQAVYLLRGSRTASNIGAITKGFIFHCPDCGFQSQLLKTPAHIQCFIQQHISASQQCIRLQRAAASGTYETAAAFGAANYSGSVEPEKVIKELLSRLVVITACHIVIKTRPPPTPIEELKGDARRAAAATAHLRTTSRDQSSSDGKQLMPYRSWAIDALSLDSNLLVEANWVRPSLAGMELKHKPSLLDMVMSPPYVAVAEHDAGMIVDKLAVLLLRQQKGTWSRFAQLMAAAATGQQIPEAVAAVEAALSKLLATDALFQRFPQQQRLELFLEMAGIPGLSDVVYTLAQPQFQVANPQNMPLKVCAVCGMSAMALMQVGRSTALHRCRYCIICTCQSCKHMQELQHPGGNAAAAAHLCLWCQGHPDTQGLVLPEAGSSRVVAGSSKGRSGGQRYSLAAGGFTNDKKDVTAGVRGQDLGHDASLDCRDSDWQQQQQAKGKKRKVSKDDVIFSARNLLAAAAAALPRPSAAGSDEGNYIDRTADGAFCDLVVGLARAAVAVARGSKLTDADRKQQAAAAAAALPSPAAVIAAGSDQEYDIDGTADGAMYDLVVHLATAAVAAARGSKLTDADRKQQAAAAGGSSLIDADGKHQAAAAAAAAAPASVSAAQSGIQLQPASNSNMLDKEMEFLGNMSLELQQAAEQLGLQGFNMSVLGQQQQQPADGIELDLHSKCQLSPNSVNRRDPNTRPDKRLCQQQQQQSKLPHAVSYGAAKPPLPPPAAAAAGSLSRRKSNLRLSAGPGAPASAAFTAPAPAAAGVVLGSGETLRQKNIFSSLKSRQAVLERSNLDNHCNPHWNKACLTQQQQYVSVVGRGVMDCGKCKGCLDPLHKKACFAHRAIKLLKRVSDRHSESQEMNVTLPAGQTEQQQQQQEKTGSAEDGIKHTTQQADLLLTAAGFQPMSNSSKSSAESDVCGTATAKHSATARKSLAAAGATGAVASDDVACTATISAANAAVGEMQQELLQMLTNVGLNSSSGEEEVTAARQHETGAARHVAGESSLIGADGAALDTADETASGQQRSHLG